MNITRNQCPSDALLVKYFNIINASSKKYSLVLLYMLFRHTKCKAKDQGAVITSQEKQRQQAKQGLETQHRHSSYETPHNEHSHYETR